MRRRRSPSLSAGLRCRRRRRCPGRLSLPRGWWRSRSSWTHSRTRSSSAPGSTSPVTNGTIAASHATASAASPSSHAPPPPPPAEARARCPAHCARTRRSTPAAAPSCLQPHQVGQGDVHHGLNRLPGPLRQQPGGDQPPHRLLQRVMAALRLAPGILRPGRGRQRIQHRAHDRGALRGQVPGQHPGAPERGLQPHGPVLERLILASWPSLLVLVLVLGPGQGAGVDLPGQPGQVRHIRAARRRPQQDRIRVLLALQRQLVGPAADGPGDRLRDLPAASAAATCGCAAARRTHAVYPTAAPLVIAGLVDQPGPRAVIRVGGVPLPGGERGQDRGPRRRPHRAGLLQHPQAVRLGLRRHRGRVGGGQVAQAARTTSAASAALANTGAALIPAPPPPRGCSQIRSLPSAVHTPPGHL